nr:putative VP3 [kestrel polyomavirus 1]
MALVPYMEYIDYLYPGYQTIASYLHHIDPYEWGPRLIRALWDAIFQITRPQIEQATTAIANRARSELLDGLARLLENARWVIVEGPQTLYRELGDYYRDLPRLRPYQYAQVAARENVSGSKIQLEDDNTQSGEFVSPPPVPGGAGQRRCPDWVLPLILGLYGSPPGQRIAPEDGPPKKKRRRPTTQQGTKITNKRRDRSARIKNRAR